MKRTALLAALWVRIRATSRGRTHYYRLNIYVEPAFWTIDWARDFYGCPVTRSS